MRRRSVRISSAAKVDYADHAPNPARQYTVLDQARHNDTILDLLNTGSQLVLSRALVGVGAKKAIVLHTYRSAGDKKIVFFCFYSKLIFSFFCQQGA